MSEESIANERQTIRIELSGKDSAAWNRIFDTFTNAIQDSVEYFAKKLNPEADDGPNLLVEDLAEIGKGFVQAKLLKPSIENELQLAEIAKKFEEIKTARAQRKQIEVDTQIKEVQLEQARLDLLERRLAMALKWLEFRETHFVRNEDGSVVLLLTNQSMMQLMADVREIRAIAPAPEPRQIEAREP